MAETRGLFGDLFGKKKDKEKEAAKPTAADVAKEKQAKEAEAAAKKAKDALAAKKAEEAAVEAAKIKANLKVDGKWGAATTAAIQTVLGTKVGGDWINNTDAKALQKKLKVTADGLFGTNSNKALQKYLGVKADGVFGPASVKALQKALNEGTFFPPAPKKPTAKAGL